MLSHSNLFHSSPSLYIAMPTSAQNEKKTARAIGSSTDRIGYTQTLPKNFTTKTLNK